jgi:hypothetical protein
MPIPMWFRLRLGLLPWQALAAQLLVPPTKTLL